MSNSFEASKCFVLIKQSIHLVHSSPGLIVHLTRKASRRIPCPSIVTKRESTRHREASSSFRAAPILRQGPLNPTLGADPFPAVTDLFCRLPSPTLFCGPEAANLGDLMRLRVRSEVQMNLSFGFSQAVGRASDTSNDKVLHQPINPIARQSDFMEKGCLKEKTTLPKGSVVMLHWFHVTSGLEVFSRACPDVVEFVCCFP